MKARNNRNNSVRSHAKKVESKPLQSNQHLARFIRILHRHLPEISERYNVKWLGLFGSYTRNEQKKNSDLDMLVEIEDDPNDTLSLLKFIELENYLSDLLGVQVDLVEKEGLKPAIGRRILEEVVSV